MTVFKKVSVKEEGGVSQMSLSACKCDTPTKHGTVTPCFY